MVLIDNNHATVKQFRLKDIPENIFDYKPKLDICTNCDKFKRLYCILVNIFPKINPNVEITQINNSINIYEENSENRIIITE